MDNNNKKDNKKESSIGGIIAFVIAIMVLLGDDLPGIFGILVVGAVIAVIIYAVSAAKKRQAKEGGTAQVKKLAEYDDDEHDDSDHEDIDHFSENLSDEEKRLRQLKSMLKNGLIEKDEYDILRRKYNL